MKKLVFLATVVCFFFGSVCYGDEAALDSDLSALIKKFKLTANPAQGRDLPSISDPKAQLGKKLFFSKTLSGGRDVACVSCHHPVLGGGDRLSLSRGADALDPDMLGPGRVLKDEDVEGPKVPRNALTTFNVGFFDAFLLWDGAIRALAPLPGKNGNNPLGISTPDSRLNMPDKNAGSNLAAAVARFPVVFDVEMRGFNHIDIIKPIDKRQALWAKRNEVRAILAKRIATKNAWKSEFKEVYGDEKINFDRIGELIGEYIRSQVFIESPWKRYVEGDKGAISESAKRGAKLFYSAPQNGGALCVRCHMGDKFTDERFHMIASPQIGRGKADGPDGEEDFGRFRETSLEQDKYTFRTPSLLNVEVTGPWGRTGAFLSLKEIVAHHFNVEESLKKFDYSKLEKSIRHFPKKGSIERILEEFNSRKEKGLAVPVQRDVSDQELEDLVAFLSSLTDPCVKDLKCLSPWVLSGEEPKEMNLIRAKDSKGSLLSKRPYIIEY